MTCCILPNNNISKKRQNNVNEVENVNEHNLSNLKDEIIEKIYIIDPIIIYRLIQMKIMKLY